MMSIPSASQHNFAKVPNAEIPRSSFDRSHGYKTTLDAGWLVPIFLDEALPGDTFNLDMTAFCRLATPLHPFMDNMFIDTQFFAVPYRLLWDNWERLNGAQTDPGDSTDFTTPQMVSPAGGYAVGSLGDYFGLPTAPQLGANTISHSALYHRAYALIWNEWYRDQNLQDSIVVSRGDGPDLNTAYVLQRRGKRHDYFTSALPWPQKGPAVELPLSGNAPVMGIGMLNNQATANIANMVQASGAAGSMQGLYTSNGSQIVIASETTGNIGTGNRPAVYADLTDVAAATINSLRQAFQIQKLYERDARGGTRYTEIIRSHFGVTSPDARMQRPEYLGGGSSPINISPVQQNSATTEDSPQGNLAAIGTATLRRHGFTKSFTEHCVVMGLVSIRADLNYQQGLNRMFSRLTRWDYYWPALSHIGEQAVLNQEIMAQGTAADTQVFGYQERYAEYRYKPNTITGQFRSSFAQSLDTWHLAQDFATLPTLNASFIVENPPVARVIAVPSEPHLLFDSYFSLRCARPMPTYSVPGLIDHF